MGCQNRRNLAAPRAKYSNYLQIVGVLKEPNKILNIVRYRFLERFLVCRFVVG